MPVAVESLTYYHPVTGAGLDLNDGTNFVMLQHDGFSGIGDLTHFSTAVPEQHGELWHGVRMGVKTISIDLLIRGSSIIDIENKKRQLTQLFNPLLVDVRAGKVGKLRLAQANGTTLQMDCILAEIAAMPTSAHIAQRAARYTFKFRSVNSPSLYDPVLQSAVYAQASGAGFAFPFSFPFQLAASGIFNSASINNQGDLRTPVVIDILGPALNPIARNTTQGRTLGITGTIAAGQHFIVNTQYDQNTATLDGVSRLDMITTADFWDLIPGTNALTLDIGGSDANTRVTISWYHRYLGA